MKKGIVFVISLGFATHSVDAAAQSCGSDCIIAESQDSAFSNAIFGETLGNDGSANSSGVYGFADNNASGVRGFSQSGSGVYGYSNASSPAAGVYGTSIASNQALGVFGNVTGPNSVGVEGQSDVSIGVYGNSTSTSTGWGITGTNSSPGWNGSTGGAAVSGAAEGAGGWGIYGRCIGSCSTGNGGLAGKFDGNVDITGVLSCGSGCNSDRRLKQNIQPLTGALDKLLELRGVTFEWKNPEEHENHRGVQTGVIAQEVEKVFPQWVRQTDKGVLNVDPDARTMVGLTVEAFRELKAENDRLKERVSALESGRQPRISGFNLNGIGLGVGGLAIAGALVASRRRREPGDT